MFRCPPQSAFFHVSGWPLATKGAESTENGIPQGPHRVPQIDKNPHLGQPCAHGAANARPRGAWRGYPPQKVIENRQKNVRKIALLCRPWRPQSPKGCPRAPKNSKRVSPRSKNGAKFIEKLGCSNLKNADVLPSSGHLLLSLRRTFLSLFPLAPH